MVLTNFFVSLIEGAYAARQALYLLDPTLILVFVDAYEFLGAFLYKIDVATDLDALL